MAHSVLCYGNFRSALDNKHHLHANPSSQKHSHQTLFSPRTHHSRFAGINLPLRNYNPLLRNYLSLFDSGACNASFRRVIPVLRAINGKRVREAEQRFSAGGRDSTSVDFVIVGAGVIGLALAHKLLRSTRFRVALVDSEQLCAGATGAGQGYIWMGHRTPGTAGWDLAMHGSTLWKQFVSELPGSLDAAAQTIGWKNTGSMLLATKPEENEPLMQRCEFLLEEGIEAHYLDYIETSRFEPSLSLTEGCGSLYVPSDSQLDAKLAVEYILKECRSNNCHDDRFLEFFHEPMISLIRSNDGRVIGIRTIKRNLYCSSVVLCTGAWSKPIMIANAEIINTQTKEGKLGSCEQGMPLGHEFSETIRCKHRIVPDVYPCKGHLLVLENIDLKLTRALMEASYTNNYNDSKDSISDPQFFTSKSRNNKDIDKYDIDNIEIAFTATIDHKGRLLLGSSRQFMGEINKEVEYRVVELILSRAIKFLPFLAKLSLQELAFKSIVRTGPRPHSKDGKPLIGECGDLKGLVYATGHDGSGLIMALATAEIVKCILVNEECTISSLPLIPDRRLLDYP